MKKRVGSIDLPQRSRWRLRLAYWSVTGAVPVCAIAWLLIVVTGAESVIVTGPAIFLLGMAAVIGSLGSGYRTAAAVGFAHMGIVVLFIAMVNVFSWSPDQAWIPFIGMGAAYLTLILPASFGARYRRPAVHEPWQCQHCGYALFGLVAPACPECGQAFDLEVVSRFEIPDGRR